MKLAHFVMGGGIVVAGYKRADYAMTHARCLTGCTVAAVDLDSLGIEERIKAEAHILDDLPDDIRLDLEIAEWDEDQTPEVQVTIDEIDDQQSDGIPIVIPSPNLSIPIFRESDKKSR